MHECVQMIDRVNSLPLGVVFETNLLEVMIGTRVLVEVLWMDGFILISKYATWKIDLYHALRLTGSYVKEITIFSLSSTLSSIPTVEGRYEWELSQTKHKIPLVKY